MASLNSGGIQAGGVQRGKHSVGKCGAFEKNKDAAGRTAPRVCAA